MDSQERPDADRFDEYDCRPEIPFDKLLQETKDSILCHKARFEVYLLMKKSGESPKE